MIIEIKPLGTLFFKDGKPFSAGSESWADTIFPPFPSTIYGSLRTLWFKQNMKEFNRLSKEDFNTEKDPTTKLRIKNIIIKKSNYFFTLPRDILQKNNHRKVAEYKRLIISQKYCLSSENKINFLFNPSKEVFSYENSWIEKMDLENYLESDISNLYLQKNSELFEYEPKIGISRDKYTRSIEEGKLYRLDMLRLKKDVGIYVDFEGIDIKEDFFKLGGEGKFAILAHAEKLDITIPNISNNKFLIYLSTPAIFKKGWFPNWLGESSLEGTIPKTDLKVRLLTMVIGKPKYIGGFDMVKRCPKPTYKAVPEGSVYYFEILSGNKDNLVKVHGNSISDIYPEQGFGICYIGKY